jgi:Tol biopolymer transport system component
VIGTAARRRVITLAVVGLGVASLLIVPGAPAPAVTPVASSIAGRILFAGTGHLGLGLVTGPTASAPLFGPGPAHFDQQGSARGGLLVFTSLRDGPLPQVYLRDATGAVRQLTTNQDAAHPRLSPDGTFVVFDSAEPGGANGTTQHDLWRVDVDGSGLRRLTDTPSDETAPDVSPDGTQITFSSDQATGTGRQIYRMPVDGGPVTAVTAEPSGDAIDPVWNPVNDGAHRNEIAYVLDDPQHGVEQTRLAGGPCGCGLLLGGQQATWPSRAPAWLPDGDGVLFVSPGPQPGPDSVYRAVAGSAAPAQLVLAEDRLIDSPTWLGPLDGGQVVVTRTDAPDRITATLQDMRPDGGDPRDLGLTILREDPSTDPNTDPLFNPAPGFDPWLERQSYTPDGHGIVVTRFEDSPAGRIERIWLTNADGSNPHPMGLAGRGPLDRDTDPAFSPDGKLLALTRTTPGSVSRVVIANVATGAIIGTIPGRPGLNDAQPSWSPDGTTIAFTRDAVINGGGGNKHVWTVPANALNQQRDLSVQHCTATCEVIDDSPAFSPDGARIAFNRKDGGGRVNEQNGILITSVSGPGCQVVLPVGLRDDPTACQRNLPDTTVTGPHQPRDVAWSPDGTRFVFSARRAVIGNSPEGLAVYDVASATVTQLDWNLPGRQKEPATQQSVDLAVTAPPATPQLTVGSGTAITANVTNHGPAASPGTVLTVSIPGGLTLSSLTAGAGTCDPATRRCALGVLAPGGSVAVTATVTGVTPGTRSIGWAVTSPMVDSAPADNVATTTVSVVSVVPVPRPRPPAADPAVAVGATPQPGFVGGRVTVTYTVRNGGDQPATGLSLAFGLPAGVAAASLPGGCTVAGCPALPDLVPGSAAALVVVLAPTAALNTSITAILTTTGQDANPANDRATVPLHVLQPKIVAVPPIGPPGFVTSVRGIDFPAGAPITLTWSPGITAAAAPTRPGANLRFAAQLLILTKDQTGPRTITATGPGFSAVTTPFLVVDNTFTPPDLVARSGGG